MPRRRRRRYPDRSTRIRTSSQSSVEIQVTEANHTVSISTATTVATRSASYGAVPTSSQPLLFRPSVPFADLLKTIRAQGCLTHQGELFTLKQLCYYLKEYIKIRELYDPEDPKTVFCDKDPLGQVFGVSTFTVHDAVSLVTNNTVPVDLCYPRCSNPAVPSSPLHFNASFCAAQNKPELPSPARPSSSLPVRQSPPVDRLECPPLEPVCQTPPKVTCDRKDPTDDAKSVEMSRTKRAITFNMEDDAQPSTSQECPREQPSACGAPKDKTRRRKRKRDAGPCQNSECPTDSPPAIRKRESSFNITCNEADGSSCYMIGVELADSEAESVYSIQSKETVIVKDSSDDFWFLDDEDDDDNTEDSSLLRREPGIAFSLEFRDNDSMYEEYEVETGSSHGGETEDDVGSESPQEEIRVTIQSEDFGFWADSESSDAEPDSSDQEWSDLDKWKCSQCSLLNRPYMRRCEKCWELRPGWLKVDSFCPKIVQSPSPHKSDPARSFALHSRSPSQRSTDSGLASSLNSSHSVPSQSSQEFSSLNPPNTTIISNLNESPKPGPSSLNLDKSRLKLTNTWDLPGRVPFSPLSPKPLRSPSGLCFAASPRSPAAKFFASSPRKRNASLGDSSDLCVICLHKPKEASIVHGKTGHQVCCYLCAKRLKRRGQPCPVCRRPIQRVIKNFLL